VIVVTIFGEEYRLGRPGRDADHSPPSSAEVKNEQELYLLSPEAPPWRVAGQIYLVQTRKLHIMQFLSSSCFVISSLLGSNRPILFSTNEILHNFTQLITSRPVCGCFECDANDTRFVCETSSYMTLYISWTEKS
jgi:hypothetical protein